MSAEFNSPQNATFIEQLHQFAVNARVQLGRLAAAGLIAVSAIAADSFTHPAAADTITNAIDDALAAYPNKDMPCEHPNAQGDYSTAGTCVDYDWGPVHTVIIGDPSTNSSRGYGYRNCTDWVAWRINDLSGGSISIPSGLGDAKNWPDRFQTNQVSTTPAAGDIAVSLSGTYGR